MVPSRLTENAAAFRNALIAWYDQHARVLPWRVSPSLYKTVVSEFMLQQTQVKTVLPYFSAWLESYPDFSALASASEEQVLKSWEGLGYYSRARNLHKLAKEIASLPADEIPRTAKQWLPFPGVGPYAAAAICSISFDDPSAVVDGNVVRILSRLCADQTAYKNSTDAAKNYWEPAQALLNPQRPGDHNQAMMELGATVCHKQTPQCLLCPVQRFCAAREQGIESSLPRLEKTRFENQTVDRAWIHQDGKFLLHKIPSHAKRMKGLHEIPTLEQVGLERPPHTTPLLERKRSITRYRITERIHQVSSSKLPVDKSEDLVWVSPSDIAQIPFSGPHRRWIEELLALA